MNTKVRIIVFIVGFLAAGIYFKFFQEPKRESETRQLISATTNEVVAILGEPQTKTDAATFNSRATELANKGTPILNLDTTAHGMVWLYPDGGIKNTSARNYRTVFFNESNRVAAVYRTYWIKDPWGTK